MTVIDPLLAPNDRAFRVTIEEGSAAVESVEATVEEPAVSVDVGTLSQLVVGTREVEMAERLGGLEIREAGVRDVLQATFPPQPVCLREFF